MIIKETKLKGCYIIKPEVFKDKRGYFIESFNKYKFYKNTGLDINFVQDNESQSSKGVLRGLHYQTGKFAQAKLVRVIKGRVLDVVVDLRPDSKTFGKHISTILSETNKTQIFIPKGFAHGFFTLEDMTIFSYKCDNYYNKKAEAGVIYSDKKLNVDWGFTDVNELIISEKDLLLPTFENAKL
ncbi:dTDP-4-dehydrorhamnose 3,5-epimerase [Winogradskyella pulchriflava]|uniref:dTDP-4-dehydrorhamnose 3,5-epimerase n=1 Tax=Winogradskyella pulchriflava TaxID=1110688 RepID=A0ABV6Q6U1_9FLAO